ncbi:MAG: enoyl-CoA hydratase/isomerase family protein, partial [Telluria sp.]
MQTDGSLPSLDIAGHVATITLRRPEVANRLGPDDL